MNRSIFIKTFGCQMNVYDSERMRNTLTTQGFTLAADARSADVVLLNTCAIRDKSEQKVRSLLGQLKDMKAKNPEQILAVSGCVGQRIGRELMRRVPELNLVFGPDQIDRVGDLVNEVVRTGKRIVETELDKDGRKYSQPALVLKAKPAEYLTIMKGCDHFCTYCIVPFVRGREKSRAISEIMGDVEAMAEKGTREITFLGQNINTFGKGTGEKLSDLIERANEIKAIERIRYVTSHPYDLGDDLIGQFGSVDKLCPALHLPFQSGSSAVLKRMFRLYTREDYLSKIEKLRRARPDIALSTDVIVGFPGETEADFEQTLSLLREVHFSMAFLFKYSPRPGTKANEFGEEIPEAVKEERLRQAQAIAFGHIDTENRTLVGKTVDVLIEALDKKGMNFTGRSAHNKIVHVMNAGEACVGKVLSVEISDATGSSLKGYYVGAPRVSRRTQKASSASVQAAAY